jgi:Cytosol aminopeptidase family, catalytic domain
MSNRTLNRYDPMPSTRVHVQVSARSTPPSVDQECALAVPVAQDAEPARELDLDAAALRSAGFSGRRGQTLVLPGRDGILRVAVDIATPTGACLRTFGVEIAGVMGNNRQLIGQLRSAGEVADEPVWELPLHRPYRRQLDSVIADMTNMGGPNAGSITGGAVPGGVRRRAPVGAHRHRGHGTARSGRPGRAVGLPRSDRADRQQD